MLSVKAIRRTLIGAGALSLAAGALTGVAQAQTAADINRANAALQLCASPAAASIPQCAQLNQQLGLGGGGASANNGSGAAAAGALLNGLANRNGGGGGLMGILGAVAGQAAQASAPAQAAPPVGSAAYQNQATAAIHGAGVAYQACVAANPTNWQPCLAHLNGGAAVNVASAAPAAAAAINLTGAALEGYQRCLSNNPAEKCAQAYGAYSAPAAPAQDAGAAVANAAAMAQTAKQLAPTLKAWGSLLGR